MSPSDHNFIQVRFYNNGRDGFKISDSGRGYLLSELSMIAKIAQLRERNEIYKVKSIGW